MCEHVFVLRNRARSERDDPARRPRRVLRVGRAARRPALRGRPVIVGGGVVLAASYEAKAFGVRTRDGRPPGPAPVPRRGRRAAPAWRPTPTASRAVFEVFDDTTPLVEGLSIDEAFLDVGGLRRIAGLADRRSPTQLRRRRARARSACRSPSASPAPSSWPRSPAASPSPTGCSWSRPTGELAFLHPLPVERLWGVGPVTAEKLHDRGITTVGDVARLAEPALVADARPGLRPPPPRAGPQPRPPARARPDGAAARSGRSAPSAGGAGRRRRSTQVLVGHRRPGDPPDAVGPDGSGARSCSASASTTSAGRPARTRSRRPPAPHAGVLAMARDLWPTPVPLVAERGSPCVGLAVSGPGRRPAAPAGPALRPGGTTASSTPPSTACTIASGRARSPGRP